MSDSGEGIRIVPIGEVPWPDVDAVFGTRGDPSSCFCQYFKLTGGTWRGATRDQCRDALHEQAQHRPGPGLIAYLDGEPAGWCAVEPRANYERLRSSRISKASVHPDFADPSIWAITCLVVRVGFRKRGIARALAGAAVEHARANGARVVEAYPVDTAERPGMSSAELYHGTVSLFLAAGLEVAARPLPGRAVMRLAVRGPEFTDSPGPSAGPRRALEE